MGLPAWLVILLVKNLVRVDSYAFQEATRSPARLSVTVLLPHIAKAGIYMLIKNSHFIHAIIPSYLLSELLTPTFLLFSSSATSSATIFPDCPCHLSGFSSL